MDRQEKHHQQHKKEHEHEARLKREHERHEESLPRRIHPAWFIVLGSVLIIIVVLVWTSL